MYIHFYIVYFSYPILFSSISNSPIGSETSLWLALSVFCRSIIIFISYTCYLQGVEEKMCFFTIHCNPSLAYIAVRDLQNSHRIASVQSLLLAGNFFVQPIVAECWLSRILGRKHSIK